MSDEKALRQELVDWAKSMFNRGYSSGGAGNISARLPDGSIIVTPTNSSFGDLDPNKLSKLDAQGNWIGVISRQKKFLCIWRCICNALIAKQLFTFTHLG